jgi:hypothetical protein
MLLRTIYVFNDCKGVCHHATDTDCNILPPSRQVRTVRLQNFGRIQDLWALTEPQSEDCAFHESRERSNAERPDQPAEKYRTQPVPFSFLLSPDS